MDERKFRILQAIIDDYILTAVPVGSRTISKKYDMHFRDVFQKTYDECYKEKFEELDSMLDDFLADNEEHI